MAYQVACRLMEELEAPGSSLPSVTLGKFMEGLVPPGTDPSEDKIVLVSANVPAGGTNTSNCSVPRKPPLMHCLR